LPPPKIDDEEASKVQVSAPNYNTLHGEEEIKGFGLSKSLLMIVVLGLIVLNVVVILGLDDGAAGTDGTDGTDGTNGANGANGTNGANGVNGVNGVNGDGDGWNNNVLLDSLSANQLLSYDYSLSKWVNVSNITVGTVTGDVKGDVKSSDGTTVLDAGTDGNDATFTGDVTGDVTGNADTAIALVFEMVDHTGGASEPAAARGKFYIDTNDGGSNGTLKVCLDGSNWVTVVSTS
jgi:hypothetical protein